VRPLRGIIDVLRDSAASVPPKLYKYGHRVDDERIRYAKELFEDNRLYFSSPDSFNDPFDSAIKCVGEGSRADWKRFFREHSVRYKPELKRAEHLRHEKNFLRNREEFVKRFESDIMAKRRQFGVFCMTHKNDNILMWAHYAGNHKGFCIEFQTGSSFFARAQEVRYENERPQANLLGPWEALTEHATRALLTKAKDWHYEDEWRIIDLDSGPGIQKCPPESISGVILGSRISSSDRQRIKEWCRNREPAPMLYKAIMKDREFGLDVIPIPY
jgi:hypothetical protein